MKLMILKAWSLLLLRDAFAFNKSACHYGGFINFQTHNYLKSKAIIL